MFSSMFSEEQKEILRKAYGKAVVQKAEILARAFKFCGKENAPIFTMSAICKNGFADQDNSKQALWAIHLRPMQEVGLIKKRNRGIYEVTPLGRFWYETCIIGFLEAQHAQANVSA